MHVEGEYTEASTQDRLPLVFSYEGTHRRVIRVVHGHVCVDLVDHGQALVADDPGEDDRVGPRPELPVDEAVPEEVGETRFRMPASSARVPRRGLGGSACGRRSAGRRGSAWSAPEPDASVAEDADDQPVPLGVGPILHGSDLVTAQHVEDPAVQPGTLGLGGDLLALPR